MSDDAAPAGAVCEACGGAAVWADDPAGRQAGWAHVDAVAVGEFGAHRAIVALDPPGGPVQALCREQRPHLGPHRWFGAGEPAGGPVRVAQYLCPGVVGVAVQFAEVSAITAVRCYGAPGCTRLLVFDDGPGIAVPGPRFGWTVRERAGRGSGDRVWACGEHS